METKDYFKDIYNDFFNVESLLPKTYEQKEVTGEDKDKVMSKYFDRINSLYIEETSKKLLKQIIEYMRKYNEKIETNYISFQIVINTKDNKTIEEIEDILASSSSYFKYITNKVTDISLYDVSEETNYNTLFTSNGLLHICDLKGLDLFELSNKKKFFHELEENIINNKETVTLISGNNDELSIFFQEKSELRTKYFTFEIIGSNPDIQDIYKELSSKVNIEDALKVKLLDYITATYNQVNDFEVYKDNLIKDLSFNKKVPEIEKTKSLDEVFKELNELVGLTKVKKVLRELVDLQLLKEKNEDLNISSLNLHMVFLGNPGTGKTTVARIVSNILYNLKYIKENKLIEVSSKDLVAEYVGQTSPKTNAVIEKALGGVLFIDEAYSLASKNSDNSYNAEAIATLIQQMENHRKDLVVIFAGYTKEMQDFLDSNSGIVSRIGYTMEFDDYTEDELISIFNGFMTKAGFIVKDEAKEVLKQIIRDNKDMPNFGNARFMRNIYEKTIIKHASNTKESRDKEVLRTITKDDINTDNLKLS